MLPNGIRRLSIAILALAMTGLLAACISAAAPAPTRVPSPVPQEPAPIPSPSPTPQAVESVQEALRRAGISTRGWKTDFSKHSVPFEEIISGGPPKDGIPAIDNPQFVSATEADEWLEDAEPVQVLDLNGDVRAYPLQILIWHEIVNDVVGGKPVAATYCPLCNTAIVFEATLPDGQVLDFGTTGKLRFSDLVMYDRQTESWWQQITGEAIVGELLGTQLAFISSPIVSWAEFKQTQPDGKVLSRETGHRRPYGQNPYVGYDTTSPFLYRGPEDDRLPAMERVATVSVGEEAIAFPFSVLEKEPVVHYTLGDQEMVVFYKRGTASALDSQALAQGRDVGATGIFIPQAAGQPLTFRLENGEIRDDQTDSTWSLLGEAIAGPLQGEKLESVVHANHFWFSWAVFKPDTIIYRGSESS